MMQLCLVAALARRWNAPSARACWVFLATVCHLTAWLCEPLQCFVLLVVFLELIHVIHLASQFLVWSDILVRSDTRSE